jgi:hypothetical protein
MACITRPTTAPTISRPTPTQNIVQFASTIARVPTAKAMVMIVTAVHAAGVEP